MAQPLDLEEATPRRNGRKILVTGGASFIGSHLDDALVEGCVSTRVIDDPSSGRIGNIRDYIGDGTTVLRGADMNTENSPVD